MRDILLKTVAALLCLASVVHAQQSLPTATATVPKLVRFSGSFHPANGMPAQPVESVTLSVYSDQTGGAALWQETQNVAVDGEGKYSVLMGSTQNDGVPMELFASGEPRWLGVQFNRPGEPEQPRVLMTSVPYALKSVDAETLGGKPASAYLLAGAASSGITASAGAASSGTSSSGITTGTVATTLTTVMTDTTTPVKPRAIAGQQGFVPYFTDGSNDLGDSVMQQSGGYIGVGTVPGANAGTTPSLDLRTSPFSQIGMAQTTDYLTFFSSDTYGPAIYWNPGKDMRFGKGGASLYNAFGFSEQMRIQSATGNVGIGTPAPVAKLEVNGSAQVDGNVTITTSGNGLIFPDGSKQTTAAGGGGGGGSVTGVTAGTDLTGGGTSGIVTVNLNTALVPTLAGANTFTASNAFTGNLSAGSLAVTGTAQAANLVATQNINFSGSVLYQGNLVLQVPGGVSNGNIALGVGALQSNSTGFYNLATGALALQHNVGGNYNTASGYGALATNVSGNSNLAVGYDALNSNTGSFNTAVGINALSSNGGGGNSVAVGYNALLAATVDGNTAVGTNALSANVSSTGNVAVGYNALLYSTATGTAGNTAVGYEALQGGTPASANNGAGNTATGYQALQSNTTGINNTAIGAQALQVNTTGANNIAIGNYAGSENLNGSSNNIDIGASGQYYDGIATNSGVIRIGFPTLQTSFYVAGVYGVTPSNGDAVPVVIDGTGQMGTVISSRRFKEDIEDMGEASRDLMRLRPVTFRYKKPFADGSKPVQYGLIAEEVAEVYPDLVAHSADGQIETVKYQVLPSMLLNEVQKQNQHAQQQDETIRRQQEQIRGLEARLATLEGLLSGKAPVAPTAGR